MSKCISHPVSYHAIIAIIENWPPTLIVLFGLLSLACTPFPASANSQATRVMQAAIMSKGNVNYSGERIVEVYSGGQRLRVVRQRIHCKQGDKQRIETVEPPSEAGSLFVSNGLRIWEYTPQKREVVVRQMQTADSLRRHRQRAADLVASQLSLQYGGRKTIASRSVHEIIIRDSAGRLLRKCWIDVHTNVELKMEKYGERGALSTRQQMTTINYTPRFINGMFDFVPPRGVAVKPAPPPATRTTLAQAQRPAGFKAIVPGYLPPSYVFEQDKVAVTVYQGKPALWLTFTNGLDTFSLFQSPCTHSSAQAPLRHDCATHWCGGGICFTLVGELPSSDIDSLVRSTRR